ncbi:hypothetical protein ACLI1A_17780 [Flavobacterium sp. RHBU_3]|uniref:hypothetical protein n=1 Tax=Flavobacterium sp. RHBU_3 TaxID=3391184 RepID=UPI00398550E7
MKTLYFFLLFTTGLFAQDLDYLKSRDTIYLTVPKEDKLQFSKFLYFCSGNSDQKHYEFKQPDGKSILILTINDKETNPKKRNLTVRRKKFLTKYKKDIVDVNFLDNTSLYVFFMEVLHANGKKKIVYIIDQKERTGKELVLRRAYIAEFGFISM